MKRSFFVLCFLLVACGDDASLQDASNNADGGMPDDSGAVDDAVLRDAGTDVSLDALVNPDTSLPDLEALEGVRAWVDGDTAYVTFDPVPGAVDYRIYELPEEGMRIVGGRLVAVRDGWFRCGGEHQAPVIGLNGSLRGESWIDAATRGDIAGFERPDDALVVGYGWLREEAGSQPVYVLGDPTAENECERVRFNETRTKRYTTDVDERTRLLAEGWRDDGVAFYVPTDESTTTALYEQSVDYGEEFRVYYAEGPEREARGEGMLELRVSSAEAEGMVPIHRVHYSSCGGNHDELIAGEEQMRRATTRGNLPVLELQWPGLSESTVFVVEALDVGCPFQGHIATRHVDAAGYASEYPSIEEVQSAEADGQVFVNAQHDPAGIPTAIRRSYVELAPDALPAWDVYESFDAPFASQLVEVDRETFGGENLFFESDDFFVNFYNIEPNMWAIDSVRGEMWVNFSDWGAGTNGKFRITPRRPAQLSTSTYLHTRMDVDIWATGRRYPQMWITNVELPMQPNLESGTSINIQTFGPWATDLQIQVCRNRTWDVNNQCPNYPLEPEPFTGGSWAPVPLAQEHGFPGRKARLDAYVSTERVYLYLENQPYACGELPTGAFEEGEVNVVFGDVLYHSGVDEPVVGSDAFPFIRDHQLTETRRYFDNLGYDEGVPLPGWPATLPCHSDTE